MKKKLIKNNLLIIPKIFKKSIPFYIPISIGIIYRLNTIALFLFPLQAISSLSKGTLSPRLRDLFEMLRLPIPQDDNLFIFFFILIAASLLNLILIQIIKEILILNIKNQILIKKKIKIDKSKLNKKVLETFSKVDNYIKTSENIILCGILVILIILFDFQIAFITLLGGILYYLIFIIQKKKSATPLINDYKYLSVLNNQDLESPVPIGKRVLIKIFKEKTFWKAIVSTSIMLLILISIYKRTDTSISIIFIFLVRIYINQMLKGINDFIELNKNQPQN